MYLDFNKKGRDLILGFLNHFFKDKDQWISKQPLELHHDISYFIEQIKELDYKESYKILTKKLKELNCSLPPLIAAYMNLSSSMKTFGTAMNSKFGDVEETGILISIDDIYPEKKDRHINTYKIKIKIWKLINLISCVVILTGKNVQNQISQNMHLLEDPMLENPR